MFQKESFSIPSDSSGILLVKIIEIRSCSKRRLAVGGKFLRIVIRDTKPILLKKKKKKTRAITIRSLQPRRKIDGLTYHFCDNALVLLKKRMNTVGKELYGPICKNFKIKKFRNVFRKIYNLSSIE
jgi:large subunit ribosomal protein L14